MIAVTGLGYAWLMRSSVLAVVVVISACTPATVTPPPSVDAGTDVTVDAGQTPDDVSAKLEPFRAAGALPGIAGAVIRGDDLVAIGASGIRKQGDPTPVTIQDQWHLGSDTKAMTATLVGLSVDEGKMKLEDTLGALFPGSDPGWSKVTLEDLLRHRGGAPADVPPAIWSQMWLDGAKPDALGKAVLAMLAMPPAQAPGTFVYANSGYMIVGLALEKAYGKGWEEQMQTRLFAPLAMASCGFGAAGTPNVVDQPWGHKQGTPPIPVSPGPSADNPRSLGPAGTVHCSLRDWGRFLSLHLAGERGEDRLVKSATIKRLHAPPAGGDYAAGWGVGTRSWAGGLTLSHAGSNTMNYAIVWLAPQKNVGFMVTTNIAGPAAEKQTDASLGPLIQTYAP